MARRVAVGRDEIDLLVAWGSRLVAVEVKTRLGGEPVEEFTAAKAARLRRAGRGLRPSPHRYDLVTVCARRDGVEVRWLPGVC
ncbi:MAG: YraN family protein [Acidimicrobiia bacterium]|nr:YraN family protein [Acidimicrobiia bacterium]